MSCSSLSVMPHIKHKGTPKPEHLRCNANKSVLGELRRSATQQLGQTNIIRIGFWVVCGGKDKQNTSTSQLAEPHNI